MQGSGGYRTDHAPAASQQTSVVSSALNGEEEKREGMEAGATTYISKGETPLPQVVEMVKQYLE